MSISSEEIEQILAEQMTNSQIVVQGQDGKYQVNVVSEVFEGLNAVKRQQAIYKILNPQIASGAIHAVSMLLKTPTEQAKS